VTLSDVLPKGLSYCRHAAMGERHQTHQTGRQHRAVSAHLYDNFPRLGEKSVITFQVDVAKN
jgi:hypothetical protein